MIKLIKSTFCASIISLGISTTAVASLISGSGLIYDTDLDITWLSDGNYASTSGYVDTITTVWDDGRMTWGQADTWAGQLDFSGFTDWRLPTGVAIINDPSCESIQFLGGGSHNGEFFNYNCTASEMGHLFFNELGAVVDINANTAIFNETIFDNLLHDNYWSGTAADPACHLTSTNDCAWDFDFRNGITEDYPVNLNFYALAVHDGDIGNLAVIPVPSAAWLFGSGLIGLVGISRRK